MDRELIRKNCRCARNIFELFKPIGMEDVCKYFIAVKITQLNALSQMNERDLRVFFIQSHSFSYLMCYTEKKNSNLK